MSIRPATPAEERIIENGGVIYDDTDKDYEHRPLDIPLLRKNVEWVMAENQVSSHTRSWEQGIWLSVLSFDDPICDSYRCFAGNIAVEYGDVFHYNRAGWDEEKYFVNEGGKIYSISGFAQMKLGVTKDEAQELFDPDNESDIIKVIAESIIEFEERRQGGGGKTWATRLTRRFCREAETSTDVLMTGPL